MPIPTPQMVAELTDYQKQMLGSIEAMMKAYQPGQQLLNISGRRAGKSHFTTNQMPQKARGVDISGIWLDELGEDLNSAVTIAKASANEFSSALNAIDLRFLPEHVVDNPKWPGAKIEIWRKETDRRDPRNPNPKAGKRQLYTITGDHINNETVEGLNFAIARATELHLFAIRKIQAQLQKDNPKFGMF